jgi:lysine 2,3-aminomutase
MQDSPVPVSKTEFSVLDDEPPLLQPLELALNVAPQPRTSKLSALATAPAWSDWRWQIRNRIRRAAQLRTFFPGAEDAGLTAAAGKFPMAITPYYASLIRRLDASDPVYLMSVPQVDELVDSPALKDDPLEEDEDMPVPGLVHRYPDRALILATTMCSMYCRHCTRKRVAGHRESCISSGRLRQITQYLSQHPEVHDVIVSGGDPFTLTTPILEQVLTAVRAVPTVDIVRIGTRTPVVMPMRITDELVAMLRQFHPLYVNTHFNHPVEMTREAGAACARLADAGIPVGHQTVLLRGVNDDPRTMEELCRKLLKNRVRPYYIFQCDLVRGVEHFRTPLARGIEIMEYLRGRISGLGIPTFVVDAPHGGGKVPITPNYVVSMSPTHTVLRNFEGMLVAYPEPYAGCGKTGTPAESAAPGVWELTTGRHSKIQPERTARQVRRKARQDGVQAEFPAP